MPPQRMRSGAARSQAKRSWKKLPPSRTRPAHATTTRPLCLTAGCLCVIHQNSVRIVLRPLINACAPRFAMSHTSIELTPVPPAYPSTAIAQLGQLPLTKTISRPGSDQATENHAAAAAAPDDLPARTELVTSKTRTAAVIACITLITSISTLLNGLTTVALPTLARDLGLREGLLLWCVCTVLSPHRFPTRQRVVSERFALQPRLSPG